MIEKSINNKNYLEGLKFGFATIDKEMKKWAISYLCLKGKGAKVMFEVRNTIPYVGNKL